MRALSVCSGLAFLSCLLAGCAGSPPAGPAAPSLGVAFTDPSWNGKAVPPKGRCQRCGGDGMSPALVVTGLPPGTEAVVVEFNDRSYEPLARGGGHGAVRLAAAGATQVEVPSYRETSEVLPEVVRLEHRHRAVGYGKGAYLGPCGCGSNNRYEAVVRAVRTDDGRERTLATGRIDLGQF